MRFRTISLRRSVSVFKPVSASFCDLVAALLTWQISARSKWLDRVNCWSDLDWTVFVSKTWEETVTEQSHVEKLSGVCFLSNVFNHHETVLGLLYRAPAHLCSPWPLTGDYQCSHPALDLPSGAFLLINHENSFVKAMRRSSILDPSY